MHVTRFLVLLLALVAPQLWAANVGVTPVAIHMGGAINRATVNVVNYSAEPVTMQAETISWKRVNGVDDYADTTHVMVNPAVFTIEPGASQVVRVGLRQRNEQAVEATYRLVLREVPVANESVKNESTAVRVLVAMRLPIYVAPDQVVQDQKWTVRQSADSVQVALQNNGNVHYKVGGIRLRNKATDTGGPALASSSDGAVLFPGESRTFTLKRSGEAALGAQPVVLEVFTDRGPEYIPVVLDKVE